jgi:hypothetical protein
MALSAPVSESTRHYLERIHGWLSRMKNDVVIAIHQKFREKRDKLLILFEEGKDVVEWANEKGGG